MEYKDIPENRKIQLDVEKLKELGYDVPSRVSFVLSAGADPYFWLVKRAKKTDISFGRETINEDGSLKIPSKLKVYQRACVTYEEKLVHVMLR